jgi:hypothetical protein
MVLPGEGTHQPMNRTTRVSEKEVRVYEYDSEALIDVVDLEEARRMKSAGEAFFINSGRDLRLVKPETEQPDGRNLKGVQRTVGTSSLSKMRFSARSLRTQNEIIEFMRTEKLASSLRSIRVTTTQIR